MEMVDGLPVRRCPSPSIGKTFITVVIVNRVGTEFALVSVAPEVSAPITHVEEVLVVGVLADVVGWWSIY